MHQTINLHQFREAFHTMGRNDQFSYQGLEVLFDYLESYEDDTGEPVELDVIALCCDYCESSIQEIIDSYSIDCDGIDPDDLSDHVESYLQENTTLVGAVADGFIYQAF